MNTDDHIHNPWMVAVWPGMGSVAISAGYYLMAKLGMHMLAEFPARDYFDLDKIEVQEGLIQTRRLPRSRLFLWNDPARRRDLILFIGEAQPPARGGEFCRQLIGHAQTLGVRRVFTFAAMATQMRPKNACKVFGAAIDRETLSRFSQHDMQTLREGSISGLNGVLLATAADQGLPGGCLLGEIPMIFSQIPFPKASLAVLERFSRLAEIPLDFTEIRKHARTVEDTLENFLVRIEEPTDEESPPAPDLGDHPARIDPDRSEHIEELFAQASKDRSRAYELKQELDRLKIFDQYEDRFLDLFINPD